MVLSLASMLVDIRPKYEFTLLRCGKYEAPRGATPDFTVEVTEEEIDREAAQRQDLPRGYLESLAIYRKLCHKALDYDTFLFHGSALAMDGNGYLFTAPSGTGKSTHASLWRQVFGDAVTMVNDDKPLIHATENGIYICGSPWDGKHALSTNIQVPLKGICLLSRGKENSISPISPALAYSTLLGQTLRPRDPILMKKTLTLLDRMMAQVPLYALTCNISPEAALVAHRGLTEERK